MAAVKRNADEEISSSADGPRPHDAPANSDRPAAASSGPVSQSLQLITEAMGPAGAASPTTPAAGVVKPEEAPTLASPAPVAGTGPVSQSMQLITEDMGPAGAPAAPKPLLHAPLRGDRIGENGRFQIVDRLGSGGMGHVFSAFDSHLGRTVAVKFILDDGGLPLNQLITLLRREAKATAKLNHENIVAIFDMDAYHGVPFLVMELLDGQSLAELLQRAPLSPLRATQIMEHVARGLAHAHAHGIIHRDLKPSNVFILPDGRAKILDFGISRFERAVVIPGGQNDTGPTVSGIGTPAFMAPEQWRGEPQDARTDIWSAGVMFYQMLTGRLPYTVPHLVLKFTVRGRAPSMAPSVRVLMPSLPEEADHLVATALSEDPEGRFQTARELLEALRELEHALGGTLLGSGIASRRTPQVERRLLTVLACSLSSGGLLDLDDMAEIEQRFYQTCADAVRHGAGTIGTPVGGKFFCCFGYPAVKETDAQRAVRAALQIAQTMREQAPREGQKVELRIGIHTGVVGLPSLPCAAHAMPAMQGDVPNVAARLAEEAAPNSVAVSQATLELTRGLFLTEEVQSTDAIDADGQRPRTPVHRVLRAVEPASRFEQAFSAELTPFVNRDDERAFLHAAWDDVKDGQGQLVVVSGEPGIGKSRLVQTLKDQVTRERNLALACQCWPQFKTSALHPLIGLLLALTDIDREDTPSEQLSKLEDFLASLGFCLPEVVPLFGSLLSVPYETRHAPLSLSAEQEKGKTLEALVSMLLRMSLSCPVFFLVEDMQWVDHSTIEYLNALINRLPASRILVVLTSRPEFRIPWSARRHLRHLSIERLSSATTAAMIEKASKERTLPDEMIERLVATTDGVPLFVEELTRMVVDSWQTSDSGKQGRMAIPGTLHELLLARLDRLRGAGKEVAQIGSILGRDFDYELIQKISPLDETTLQDGLKSLIESGLLHHQGRPPAARYVFKHALIQQAAYQSLAKSDRQRYHRRTAEILLDAFPLTASLQPEIIAYHLTEGGNPQEALAFWERAGQHATQRSALVEAIDHYGNACEALKALPEGPERDRRELGILLALGSPLMSVHGYATPEVEKIYARARDLAQAAGGQVDLFPALQGLWQFYYVRGILSTARELGKDLLAIAESTQDSTFLLLAHRAYATTVFLHGDIEAARFHLQTGFSMYDMRRHGSLALRTGHDPGVAHGAYLSWALWMLGYPDQALSRVLETVALARQLMHPLTLTYALCFVALVRNCRGEHSNAKTFADEALEITREHKFALWTAWAKLQRGWALGGQGDLERGIAQMKQGLDEYMKTGARVGVSFFPVTLAEICLRAGQLAEAARLLDEARLMVDSNDEHFYEAEMCRLRGELSLEHWNGATEAEAEAHFRRGLEIARARKSKSWELRLAMSRSHLLYRQGEPLQARDELREALAWFSEGHDTADLVEAHTRIQAYEQTSRQS